MEKYIPKEKSNLLDTDKSVECHMVTTACTCGCQVGEKLYSLCAKDDFNEVFSNVDDFSDLMPDVALSVKNAPTFKFCKKKIFCNFDDLKGYRMCCLTRIRSHQVIVPSTGEILNKKFQTVGYDIFPKDSFFSVLSQDLLRWPELQPPTD